MGNLIILMGSMVSLQNPRKLYEIRRIGQEIYCSMHVFCIMFFEAKLLFADLRGS